MSDVRWSLAAGVRVCESLCLSHNEMSRGCGCSDNGSPSRPSIARTHRQPVLPETRDETTCLSLCCCCCSCSLALLHHQQQQERPEPMAGAVVAVLLIVVFFSRSSDAGGDRLVCV